MNNRQALSTHGGLKEKEAVLMSNLLSLEKKLSAKKKEELKRTKPKLQDGDIVYPVFNKIDVKKHTQNTHITASYELKSQFTKIVLLAIIVISVMVYAFIATIVKMPLQMHIVFYSINMFNFGCITENGPWYMKLAWYGCFFLLLIYFFTHYSIAK